LNDGTNESAIDPNFENNKIEWLIKGKNYFKFNKKSPIVCTGLMCRITDKHPALLKESAWWFEKHLCDIKKCCHISPNVTKQQLEELRASGEKCKILYK